MEYRKTESLRLIESSDGSHSLSVEAMNETYHSFKGAVQESQYVFIEKGLGFVRQTLPPGQTVHILEVGFGTGLNALLTQGFADRHSLPVAYTTLEPYPLPAEITCRLNHGRQHTHHNHNSKLRGSS